MSGPHSEELAATSLHIVTFCRAFSIIERLDVAANTLETQQRLRATIENLDELDVAAFVDRFDALVGRQAAVAVISDQFASEIKSEAGAFTSLAYVLRYRCRDAKAILYLLGLEPSPAQGIRFVDHVINVSANEEILGKALQRAFSAIKYKQPPQRKSMAPGKTIEVGIVATAEDFRRCLTVRHDVYSLLGYLHGDRDALSAELDLDDYDPSSLHFIAVASDSRRSFAGTARLVISRANSGSGCLCGDAAKMRQTFGGFCNQIASSNPHLRRKLEKEPRAASLPLLAAFNFGCVIPRVTVSVDDLCELSRVIVAEEFRGLGVSRLLVQAAIAAAADLKLKYMLLECIPQHVVLYEKFGFQKVDAKPEFAWGIDREAVVMSRHIDEAESSTSHDIAMMLASRTNRDTSGPPKPILVFRSTCNKEYSYA